MSRVLGAFLAILMAAPALGDGGQAEFGREITLGATLDGVAGTVPKTESPEMLARLRVINASGMVWQALDIRIEVWDDARADYLPSSATDSLSVGSSVLPFAAWRELLELRINGVYAGRPGGNWEFHIKPEPETLQLRFLEPLIGSGDRIEIRFPMSDVGIQLWRMHLTARTADN
jgi:hypothetical protein